MTDLPPNIVLPNRKTQSTVEGDPETGRMVAILDD